MQRVCFILQWKEREGADEEGRLRRQAWPETLAALRGRGWRNYSVFRGEDGLLVGYVEAPDIEKVRDCMAALEAEIRFRAGMAESSNAADIQVSFLDTVFHVA